MKNWNKASKMAKFTLCTLATFCIAILAVGGFYYSKLLAIQDKSVQIVEKPQTVPGVTPIPTPKLETISRMPDDLDIDYDVEVSEGEQEKAPIYVKDAIQEDVVNILFLGEDTRPYDSSEGRADTMMLLSFNRLTGDAKLVSFLRDTYIFIPDRKTYNRINAAFRIGGVGAAINTINENFDLDIQNYIMTDFTNMIKIVDLLGGLEIKLTKKEAALINKRMSNELYDEQTTSWEALPEKEGTYLLTGEQLLAHCRNRYTGDGDWGRTRRQREVMLALFERIKQEKDVATLVALINKLMGYVKTNMDPTEIIQLGVEAVSSNNITFKGGHIPFDETWKYASVNGASVIKLNLDENKELLHGFLYSEG